MTTIAAALNRVARQVSVIQPDNWISASALEHVEIRDDFLPEAISEILDRVDLPPPISATFDITGTGVETYALPANFLRLQRDVAAVYQSANTRRALVPITDDGTWTHLRTVGTAGTSRYYRLTGYDGNYSISILKEPTGSLTVHYVTKNWKANSLGAVGDEFTDVSDVLLLPRRLVETATVMRWRHRKGLPYDALLADYESQLSRMSNDRRARRTINFGEQGGEDMPWQIPVPDFIPET